MISEALIWTIFLLPLGAFVFISLVVRPFFNRYKESAGLLTVLSIGVALALSSWTLQSVITQGELSFAAQEWLAIGPVDVSLGLIVDPLTAIMLVVATGVSLMVQIYSIGYMKGDPGYARYFAIMNLFTASMVGLVMASNIVQMYVFWELVGVCSYLLIGFWFTRPAAAAAAKKAFIVTRIGDFGFLLAILYIFYAGGSLDIASINALEGLPEGLALTWVAAGIFAGAVGKSAQFPLHVWLPDAMEGPTPVSALIHAATMVAAGVFLVARFFPLFEHSADAMSMVAIVGAFTALFAATMGMASYDIKRVMAFSTVSQLGFMIAALGIGAYGVAIFHLFNHAFFKALLFMGAGSVNHATGTFDMRYMGGLRKVMPWTYWTVLIASLSLSGIFPFAGFWSKDEILIHAWRGGASVDTVVFWLLIVAAFLTALYTFRMVYMTFHGEFRGGVEREMEDRGEAPEHGGHGVHLAESPVTMVAPMVLLAAAALTSGYLANPLGFAGGFLGIDHHWFSSFMLLPGEHIQSFSIGMAVVSVLVAVGGILIATVVYLIPRVSLDTVGRPFLAVRQLLFQRYYMDDLYERHMVYQAFYRGIGATLDWFDRRIVDNVAEFVGWSSRNVGRAVAVVQTGQVQGYALAITVGIFLIVIAFVAVNAG